MKNLKIVFGILCLSLTSNALFVLAVRGEAAGEIYYEMPVRSIREGNSRSREIVSKFQCLEFLSFYIGYVHSCTMWSYMHDDFRYIFTGPIATKLYHSLQVQAEKYGVHSYKEVVKGTFHCTMVRIPGEEDQYHCTLNADDKK